MYFCARKTLKIRNSRKMKTIYNRIILFAMTLMMSLSTFAATFSDFKNVKIDGMLYQIWLVENGSPFAMTRCRDDYDYISCSGNVTIPFSVAYEIGDVFYSNLKQYENKKVEFPVLYVSERTFLNCNGITSITLPNSVIRIFDRSFWGCGLSSVTIPCTAAKIDGNAFAGCRNLYSVTNLSYIPQNINYTFEQVFEVYGDLHVLKGRKEVYQKAPVWKYFNIIDDVEITPTMVTEIIDVLDIVQKHDMSGLIKTEVIKHLITNARSIFGALDVEQQALVKNISHLVEAEEAYGMSVPSGIADINADNSVKNGKYLENGKLVIVKDGKKFNVSGLRK